MSKNSEIKSWVIEYSDYLLQLAVFKTGDKQVAEDLVQDTFISAYQGFDQFKKKSSPKTWLVSIIKNKIIDHQRKESRQAGKIPSTSYDENQIINDQFDNYGNWKKNQRPVPWDNESENLLDNSNFIMILNNCTSDLPTIHEAVLRLKYIDNKNSENICKELEISTSNYWQLIHRAKLKLRKCLDIKWFKN